MASLRATLDATSDGLLALAADQAVVHYNASFLRMWSITPVELQPRPVFDLLCSRVRNGTTARIHFECSIPLHTMATRWAWRMATPGVFQSATARQTDEQGRTYRLYALSGAPREAFAKLVHPHATPIFAPTFAGRPPDPL